MFVGCWLFYSHEKLTATPKNNKLAINFFCDSFCDFFCDSFSSNGYFPINEEANIIDFH